MGRGRSVQKPHVLIFFHVVTVGIYISVSSKIIVMFKIINLPVVKNFQLFWFNLSFISLLLILLLDWLSVRIRGE